MGILGNVGKALKKAVKDTGNAVKKGVVDTGHVAGKVVTSKVGQAVIGGALAATGVGAPAAIAIGAATKAGGNLIKPGGNLKSAATGAYQGAALGAGAAVVGSGVRAIKSGTGVGGFKNALLHGKDAIKPKTATATIAQEGPPPAMIEPEYTVEPIVPGVTDSGEIKHDATDLNNPREEWIKQQKAEWETMSATAAKPKPTPTDLLTPYVRPLLASPSKPKGSDNDGNVSPRYRTRENAATVLPVETGESNIGPSGVTETEPQKETMKDNLPMLLAVGAAGVVMLVVLGRQARK